MLQPQPRSNPFVCADSSPRPTIFTGRVEVRVQFSKLLASVLPFIVRLLCVSLSRH